MNSLRKIHWFLSQQLGIDIRRLARAPIGLIRYFWDLMRFARSNKLRFGLQPCLHDWWDQAGAIDNEYFWQDLFVARMIHDASPARHVDVGSRLDGFVAHLAAFRDVEVFDVRPLNASIPGVTFRRADMMDIASIPEGIADSVSCLHAIEHFGLGRYGDPILVDGVERGFQALAKLLRPGGTLYLSSPFGADAVYFNAHRTMLPETIRNTAAKQGLVLSNCWLFNSRHKSIDLWEQVTTEGGSIADCSLAIYTFCRSIDDAGPMRSIEKLPQ